MKITLNNVIPHPLVSINQSPHSIWGTLIELNKGKRIMLNASSGKGKSIFTTTSIGLREDYEGEILYDGRDIKEFNSDDWATIRKSEIAVVFQDLQLFPKLTVKENLLLKNRLTDTYTETELMQLLETLNIENKWSQQCGLLSMGQQQRVAIIRAISQPYSWLIMDEPFSHLDIKNRDSCLDLIHTRTLEQGAGFVLTTLGDSHEYNYDQELKI